MWITCRKISKDCENTHFIKLAGIKQNLPFGAATNLPFGAARKRWIFQKKFDIIIMVNFTQKVKKMYKHTDYYKTYGRIMQFNKNKKEPIHRWYPFVEGYSREFIQSIVAEMESTDLMCLEPFSGSGTTALELQNCGIPCFSFEVNPLMYLIARVKMERTYDLNKFDYWYDYIVRERKNANVQLITEFNTLYQGDGKKKWNYDETVAVGVEKLKSVIETIPEEIYRELYKVALASILLEVSNLYRNG